MLLVGRRGRGEGNGGGGRGEGGRVIGTFFLNFLRQLHFVDDARLFEVAKFVINRT